MGKAQRIQELDGLRGIAIMLVIGCHYEVFARQFGGLPKFGWVGVDLFFVLSGFLITLVLLSLRGADSAFKTFYERRFRRILPPYIALLVLIRVIAAALNDHAIFRLRPSVADLLFLQSFGGFPSTLHQIISGSGWQLVHTPMAFTKPGMTGHVSEARDVLWSLSIEEYFYLAWAPIVLWMSRRWVAITGAVICLGTFAVRWLGFIGLNSYFSIFHRFDAPVLGALVALLLASDLPRKLVDAILIIAGVVGASTLAFVIVSMGNVLNMEVRDDHVFAVFGIPALSLTATAIVGLCVTKTGSGYLWFLRSHPLGFVGKISYTLYLLHGLVYLTLLSFLAATWVTSIAALVCAVALSWISWTYLERPILEGHRSNKKLDRQLSVIASERSMDMAG